MLENLLKSLQSFGSRYAALCKILANYTGSQIGTDEAKKEYKKKAKIKAKQRLGQYYFAEIVPVMKRAKIDYHQVMTKILEEDSVFIDWYFDNDLPGLEGLHSVMEIKLGVAEPLSIKTKPRFETDMM